MGMKLFDDAGNDDELEKIEINQEFAKRYEHNKKREDLQKYEEMKKKGEIMSGSESESESDSYDDDDDIEKFFDGITKIRKKDPILLQKEAKLFESSDEDDEGGGNGGLKKEKKQKPKYLKDLNARNLIEEGAEFDDEEEDEEIEEKKKMKSFVEEQEDLRKEVLAALAAEDGGGGELLIEKVKDDGENDEGGENDEIKQKLDEFFGEDEKLDENDMFLKDFFKNKMWIDKGKGNAGEDDDELELSDDEKAIEKQEEYERDYNFRFEESNTDRVLGHSRVVEGSVRKETNARKQQRDRKKERLELAELARREEVKRLKNLKRRELQEKLVKIREIAGVSEDGIPLNEDDLEKDFDPDEFDSKMNTAFGDRYYDAEDVDPEFGNENENENEGDLEKPDFDKEDELLGLPKNWDVIKSKDGFLAKRGESKKGKEVVVEDEEEDGEEEEGLEEGKRKRKRKSKLGEALKKELEEELYKYDYEDAIGDLKTRFKYRQVKADRYKLSAAEILWLDEQELNQYVSLKKLATYRENEWKVPQMRKKMLLEGALNVQSKQKKRKFEGEEGPSDVGNGEKSQEGEGEENGEEHKLSRSARRRKNRKDRSLPASRALAYGISSGSKKQKS